MGDQAVRAQSDGERLRHFTRKLLNDVRAMEMMLDSGIFESGKRRIGAEQEMVLVDQDQRPALVGPQILERLDHPQFTTELGRFNIELNLEPLEAEGGGFRNLEEKIRALVGIAREKASELGADIVLTGILPTLERRDLSLDCMTPLPRYRALDDSVRRLRGAKEVELFIKGRDELALRHDNVMLEACNTSFQVHLQVDPDSFARSYNIAQLLTAPVLAVATNSPLLFGRALWRETRIAVFRQAIDTRHHRSEHRQQSARVRFGDRWIDDSVLEIFREDIARFRVLIAGDHEEDSLAVLEAGGTPKLRSLALFNGTVYRWNRACFGVSGNKAHLRIENRVLPSGPSIPDEVANTALWVGLMAGMEKRVDDVRPPLPFEIVGENFLAAARRGLDARLGWFGGKTFSAERLLLEELLPLAREGLDSLGCDAEDRDRYLGIVEERIQTRRTGSQWLLDSFDAMAPASIGERCASLTAAIVEHQKTEEPVHLWEVAARRSPSQLRRHYAVVGSLMSRDLFTVGDKELIDLAATLMDWRHIRHIPVEDTEHRLLGLVTHRNLMRWMRRHAREEERPVPVSEVMITEIITVSPTTPTLEAVRRMRENRVSCLPVVHEDRLVGIVTERDFIGLTAHLLESFLEE